MSYPQTLAGNKNNPSNYDRLVCNDTTSQATIYQSNLIDFVYREVIAAVKKRSKGEIRKLDLDSLDILVKAQRKADEQLRGGLIIN